MPMAQASPTPDGRSQIEVVLRVLEGKTYARSSPIFQSTLDWLAYATTVLNDVAMVERLINAACHSFTMPRAELYGLLGGIRVPVNGTAASAYAKAKGSDEMLRGILPKAGWFEWYDDYTRQTESPLSYHIFSSFCILGAALGRRVKMRMGFFDIFPNWCCVLIGPTGRVKKTSAANIAKSFISGMALCPIMADALTPEALGTALARDGGHQMVYAPEFAVLFNRQKYNETLTTRIIRLLDCPQTFEVETVARGKEEVHDVALSFLGCSTPSLFTGATPDMVTSSGFLNRFLLVIEDDTDREFPVPEKGERRLEIKIEETIKYAKKLEGEMILSTTSFALYKKWYHDRREYIRGISDEIHAEAIERGADHMLRTAMLMHIAQHRTAEVCEDCFGRALQLLQFTERNLPYMVGQIRKSQRDADSDRILQILKRNGNIQSHSDLLRKSRLDATSFKRAVGTLLEARTVTEKKHGSIHLYVLAATEGGAE